VDEYERLINAPDIRQNMTPTEALSKLYLAAKTKFSEEVVVALIQTLSVYPPGTVVELSDKSIGLVISINLHSRMRPLVILYDPSVDAENPNIADLSHDTTRPIVRSITRNELSQEMSDYLNLTRWTGYFINSSVKALEENEATQGVIWRCKAILCYVNDHADYAPPAPHPSSHSAEYALPLHSLSHRISSVSRC
jgi:hypothetical protein